MTEDEFEPSSGEPAAHHDPETQPIALPSVTPPPPVAPASGPPTSTYALGALAGNPRLGPPPGPGYPAPPIGTGFPWPPPATPAAMAPETAQSRRGRSLKFWIRKTISLTGSSAATSRVSSWKRP